MPSMTVRARNTCRSVRAIALTATLSLPLVACDTTTQVYGAEVTAYLARVSVDEVTAQLMQGSAPAPSTGPSVTLPGSSEAITGGSSQADLVASADFHTVAIRIDGVDGYYLVSLPQMVSAAELVVTIGSALPNLDFDYYVAVAGSNGEFGPYTRTSISALSVIGGDIQVSVTWSNLADVDLHVIDPNGEEIFYANRSSSSGGELDLDANAACATSEVFQENIGWRRNTALSGEYTVRVEYWSACGELQTDYVVTVNLRPGIPVTPITPGSAVQTFSRTFTGPGTGGGAGSGTTITQFTF